jgi:MFS family permease
LPVTDNKDFLRLWIAQAVSALGSRFTRTALPILAISMLGVSATELGVLGALGVAPAFLVGLLAGRWIDRERKLPLLVASDIVRGVAVLSVPIAAWMEWLTPFHLYVVVALNGAASSVFRTADFAFLPRVGPKSELVESNARLRATDSIAEIAGPGIAGVAIQLLGAPIAIVVDSLSFFWSAMWLRGISSPDPRADPQLETKDDILTGVRLCLAHPDIRPLFLAEAIHAFSMGFFVALYMMFALEVVTLDAGTIGLIIGVGGVGGLAGAAIVRRVRELWGERKALLRALAVGQVMMLAIPLSAAVPPLTIPLLVLHQLLGDASFVAYDVVSGSMRQRVLRLEDLGKAQGAFEALDASMLTVGTIIAGILGDAVGVGGSLWIGIVLGLVAPLPLLLHRSPV